MKARVILASLLKKQEPLKGAFAAAVSGLLRVLPVRPNLRLIFKRSEKLPASFP